MNSSIDRFPLVKFPGTKRKGKENRYADFNKKHRLKLRDDEKLQNLP